MAEITKILVPFDFSDSAKRALEYAVEFVGREEIPIDLVHVPDDPDDGEMHGMYEDLREEYEKRLKIPLSWTIGSDGKITDVIIEAQKERKADIIFMGTSGLSKDNEASQTSKLVAKAKCPVIVIPESTKKKTIRDISLVLGQNEIDRPKLLDTLLNISQKFNAKVHVLTVQNTPDTYGYSKTDEKNENTLMYYLENFYSDHTFIENLDIVEGIFSYVEDHKIDMIVILPRNQTKKGVPSNGLLTKELVLRSQVPVMVLE